MPAGDPLGYFRPRLRFRPGPSLFPQQQEELDPTIQGGFTGARGPGTPVITHPGGGNYQGLVVQDPRTAGTGYDLTNPAGELYTGRFVNAVDPRFANNPLAIQPQQRLPLPGERAGTPSPLMGRGRASGLHERTAVEGRGLPIAGPGSSGRSGGIPKPPAGGAAGSDLPQNPMYDPVALVNAFTEAMNAANPTYKLYGSGVPGSGSTAPRLVGPYDETDVDPQDVPELLRGLMGQGVDPARQQLMSMLFSQFLPLMMGGAAGGLSLLPSDFSRLGVGTFGGLA